ncbi:MAG: flagellar hook protein FlgK [Pseudomonadota bacterium]
MSTIFSIGQSALSAAQIGVNTAGNNIANVSTPGYSRQQVVQTVAASGEGTRVADVQRVYSDYLGRQLVSSQSANSQLQTQYSQIQPIERMLSDSTTAGLGPALQNFFNGLQDLAAAPADPVARQALLSNAEALTSGFQQLQGRLDEVDQSLNQQIASSVSLVNESAQRLVDLNQAILSSGNLDEGKSSNDLLDQRNQLVSDLSKQIKVTVSEQGGEFNLFIGNGQPLVLGTRGYSLQTLVSKTDPKRTEVAYGDGTPMKADDFAGGALGGLLEFRDQTLVPTQNALGRVALGLASGVNAQHRQGITLDNQSGGDFFDIPPMSTIASSANQGNATLQASLADVSKLGTSDYSLQRSGDSYRLIRSADQKVINSSTDLQKTLAAAATEGLTLNVTGEIKPGDAFLIRPTAHAAGALAVALQSVNEIAAASTSSAVGDNGNLLKMADLQSTKVLEGGSRSYQSAYVQLVGQVGSKTRELEVTSIASEQIQTQAERSLQDVAGVNLDEEAANLIRYQQSYQAAGKVIQLAKQMFDTVLSISN